MTEKMKFLAAWGFFISLVPSSVAAVCAIEPLEPQLRAADTVYVGTVVRSELAPSLESLRSSNNPREPRAVIEHTLAPEITLKGDPSRAALVFSTGQYNNPRSKVMVNYAERSALMPGDTLLVAAKSGEQTFFGSCTATREWDAETGKVVYSVFPPVS
jgi:hypothetical protein